MDTIILKKIAEIFIKNINEASHMIKQLQINIRDKRNSKEINDLQKNTLSNFETLLSISETKFVLPEKLIDTILILFTKFFDTCFSYEQSDINILAEKLPVMIYKFLTSEQNYIALNLTQKEFIRNKWNILENLAIFIISFIDKYQNDRDKSLFKFDLQSYLKNIINCFELLYFSLEENISDRGLIYKIMPGVISKIIKLLSFKDIKLTSKILIVLIKIIAINQMIIFENLKIDYAESNGNKFLFNKNFITFYDFYNIFHIKLKETVNCSSKKLNKIIPSLLDLNVFYVREFTSNKAKIEEILILNKIKYDEFFTDRAKSIFEYLNYNAFNLEFYEEEHSYDFSPNSSINNQFLTISEKLFNHTSITEKLNQVIKNVSVSLNKQEFYKFNNQIPDLMISFLTYLRIYCIGEEHIRDFIGEKRELKNIFDIEEEESKNKEILESIFDLVFNKIINIKENLIFELVNNYEIQINKISKSKALETIKKLVLQTLANEKEINFNKIFKFLHIISLNFPCLHLYFLNKHLNKLNKSTRFFRKVFSTEENHEETQIILPINEVKSTYDDLLKIFSGIIIYFYTSINYTSNTTTEEIVSKKTKSEVNFRDICNKLFLSLKHLSLYYSSFLSDHQDQLDFVKQNEILLLNSLLIQINCYLLEKNKNIFNKNEKNNILMLALSFYSNKMYLLKYSSLLFLINYTTTNNNPNPNESDNLDLKEFVKNNFDFIINTTINKIIYFDKKDFENKSSAPNYKNNISKSISNYKLDILNFFNSLILFLKDLNDDDLANHYCGELNNFIKKLFIYLDMFFKDKNFFNLECLLEIIEKITDFQNYIIEKNWGLFKLEKDDCNYKNHKRISQSFENDEEYNKISDFFKENLKIKDCNLFRNLILRINPLLLCNKLIIISKCVKIFENLIHVFFILPMKREENKNFSTEDGANVLVKSSLGPIMHESWPYFIYILKNNKQGLATKNILNKSSSLEYKYNKNNDKHKLLIDSSTISNLTNQNLKMILELFIKVADHYPNFFNESRLFLELLPIMHENFHMLFHEYSFIQILPLFSVFLDFLIKLNKRNNTIFDREDLKNRIIEFFEELLFQNSQDSNNYTSLPIVEKEKIYYLIESIHKTQKSISSISVDFSVKLDNFKNKL